MRHDGDAGACLAALAAWAVDVDIAARNTAARGEVAALSGLAVGVLVADEAAGAFDAALGAAAVGGGRAADADAGVGVADGEVARAGVGGTAGLAALSAAAEFATAAIEVGGAAYRGVCGSVGCGIYGGVGCGCVARVVGCVARVVDCVATADARVAINLVGGGGACTSARCRLSPAAGGERGKYGQQGDVAEREGAHEDTLRWVRLVARQVVRMQSGGNQIERGLFDTPPALR